MRGLRKAGFVIAFVLAAPVYAATTPAPFELQAGLAGRWTGTLGYRDYQSNRLFELQMTTEIQALADKATVIRISAFDDGPKAGVVYITSASLYDPASSTVATTTFRKGRDVESVTEKVIVVTYTDPTHWVVRYEAEGTDGDQAASLRTTETRDGETVRTVKEVMPKSESAKGWQYRNETRLTRTTN